MTVDLVARVQQLATRAARESALRAAANRARFPHHAAVLDEFRAVFGAGCRWVYVYDEHGSVGRPGPAGVVASTWVPVRKSKEGTR